MILKIYSAEKIDKINSCKRNNCFLSPTAAIQVGKNKQVIKVLSPAPNKTHKKYPTIPTIPSMTYVL